MKRLYNLGNNAGTVGWKIRVIKYYARRLERYYKKIHREDKIRDINTLLTRVSKNDLEGIAYPTIVRMILDSNYKHPTECEIPKTKNNRVCSSCGTRETYIRPNTSYEDWRHIKDANGNPIEGIVCRQCYNNWYKTAQKHR